MANHRPKSLNELNQVYDKAMKAERAIKEGSMSLSEQNPSEEKPSENIFDQLREQADQAKKTELYDADIANIANDFIKRFAQTEKSESRPAPKELKRPAPSIQSLYHTPVKPSEPENEGVSLKMDQVTADEAVPSPVSFTAKPHSPEKTLPDPSAVIVAAHESEAEAVAEPFEKTDYQLQQEADTSAEERREATERAQPEIYSAPRQVPPTVRITSSERSSLMDEYLRVMSDEDDDASYKKTKKFSLFGRKKKHQEEIPEENFDSFTTDDTPIEEYQEDVPVVSFDSSSVKLTDDVAEPEYSAEEDEFSEELPMNLYDYIEADFDEAEESTEDSSSDIPLSEDFADSEESATQEEKLSYEEIIAEDFPDEDMRDELSEEEMSEDVVPEEAVIEETITEEDLDENETAEEIDEAIESAIEEENSDEAEEEVSSLAQDDNSAAEYAEEIITPTEDEQITQEDSPTAGMIFDDVFSVSDENMRSYTGGDWTTPSSVEADEEPESSKDDAEEAEISAPEKPRKCGKGRKKRKPVITALLSLVLVVLVSATALVTAIGGFIGVDTGKLFGDSYRAFSAEQNFSLSGVYAGDLIITQDYSNYDADGDSFVYVNYDTKEFMVGKYKGYTYDISGDVLYIAENEAGRILVAREDTLGAVTETYSDIGTIAGFISENYIIIDAVLLALCLAVIIVLILPLFRRSSEKNLTAETEELQQYREETAEAEDEIEYEEAPDSSDDDDDFDFDYDTDNIEEGLFSGI